VFLQVGICQNWKAGQLHRINICFAGDDTLPNLKTTKRYCLPIITLLVKQHLSLHFQMLFLAASFCRSSWNSRLYLRSSESPELETHWLED
jgi:hypothetical protein